MKKATLEKKIAELSKFLTSERSKTALETLRDELSSYQETDNKESTTLTSKFEVPKEILGDATGLAVYTDGACRGNPGPGSYGYLIQNSAGEILGTGSDISNPTTNNKMELMAVIAGLEEIEATMTFFGVIHVYSDSKYVVDGMNSWVAGWKKRGWKKADKKVPENIELWQRLDKICLKLTPTFNWVKGHAGHPQNEYVDQLANIALDESGF